MQDVTIDSMVQRWSGLERPLFRGRLIDTLPDGTCAHCAQGDVLSCAGFTNDELKRMEQGEADKEVARILGISITHAILLRSVNDNAGGCPQLVLSHPEQVLGDKAPILLAFWLYLDNLPGTARAAAWDTAWDTARDTARAAAWDTARDTAWAAARDTAWAAARAAAWAAARAAARAAAWAAARAHAGAAPWAAAWASSEIQGMDKLEADGCSPYFLAFFGLGTWDKVRALVEKDKPKEIK
jgi:hypothetical protein